ncbi:MAG: TVP38/TMEM64 family protein [Bdellovibrionales bacterium]|nr:TVP38/TMEM64 family protein [Bdellovibrionales bacterium]
MLQASKISLSNFLFFFFTYTLSTIFFIPGSILTLLAGALYGIFWGTLFVSISSLAGASASMVLGRYFFRNRVKKLISKSKSLKALDELVSQNAFWTVLLIRLSPSYPFNLLNYAFGMTKISFWTHLWASALGMLPGTFLYVYLGKAIGIKLLSTQNQHRSQSLFWMGLCITMGISIFLSLKAKNKVKEKLHDKS